MIKGNNNCRWLMVGSFLQCGKKCVFEHCKQHRVQLRKRLEESTPCRKCGVGTMTEGMLCYPCGGARIKQQLMRAEHTAKIRFKGVLIQLLKLEIESTPCRKCGSGTVTESRLCYLCGDARIKRKLVRTECRATKNFKKVMVQLFKKYI